MEARFTIFIPIKKFYWPADRVLLGLLILALILLLLFSIAASRDIILYPLIVVGSTFFIYYLYRAFFPSRIYQMLRGILEGELLFKENEISINNNSIYTSDILKMDLLLRDFYGAIISQGYRAPDIRSQGVGNTLTLHMKDGTTITVQFKIEKREDFNLLIPALMSYTKQGFMTFMHVYQMLGLGYAEIQELKKTYYISE